MHPPRVLQNYVTDLKCAPPQRKLSRPLVAFFGVFQLLFGFYFGFVKSNGMFKIAIRLATTVAGCIMIVVLSVCVTSNVAESNSYNVYLLQYVPSIIILRAAKYTLNDFLTDLLAKNKSAQPDENGNKTAKFLWLYATILFGAKIATSIVYCSLTTCSNLHWIITHTAINVPTIALDIIPMANLVIFYHVYARLKNLCKKYECQEINLHQLQHSYKGVADDFDKFRSNYDAIFVWGFVTESGKWMVIIWNLLILFKYSNSWWLYVCNSIWSFIATFQICVPAVFAEMISVQTDAMKIILQGQLLAETDEAKAFDLTRLLRYVEARPLLRKAWRLVPVDLRLPVTMLSICTTYLIVIIQFTHLYD